MGFNSGFKGLTAAKDACGYVQKLHTKQNMKTCGSGNGTASQFCVTSVWLLTAKCDLLLTTCTTFHGQTTRHIRTVQNIFQHSTTLSTRNNVPTFQRQAASIFRAYSADRASHIPFLRLSVCEWRHKVGHHGHTSVSMVIPGYGVLVVTAKVGLWVTSQGRFLSCHPHFVYTETWLKSTSFNDRTTRWQQSNSLN